MDEGVEVDSDGNVTAIDGEPLQPDRLYRVGSFIDLDTDYGTPSLYQYFQQNPDSRYGGDSDMITPHEVTAAPTPRPGRAATCCCCSCGLGTPGLYSGVSSTRQHLTANPSHAHLATNSENIHIQKLYKRIHY